MFNIFIHAHTHGTHTYTCITHITCTHIYTMYTGDSAKALAISGLGVVGRDYYGVFPLKGK